MFPNALAPPTSEVHGAVLPDSMTLNQYLMQRLLRYIPPISTKDCILSLCDPPLQGRAFTIKELAGVLLVRILSLNLFLKDTLPSRYNGGAAVPINPICLKIAFNSYPGQRA